MSLDDVQWLSNHVGVQEDNIPIDLCGYSSYGTFYTSPQQSRFDSGSFHSAYTYLLCKDIPATDQHGLTCHKACYQFLHERLKYKLQFQEVWPLLIRLDNPSPSQMPADSKLDDKYGGMTKYNGQVTANLFCWLRLTVSDTCCNKWSTNQVKCSRVHCLGASCFARSGGLIADTMRMSTMYQH